MGKAGSFLGRHRQATIYAVVALLVLAVLVPIHLGLAYEEVSGRNAAQIAALQQREDIQPQGFAFAVCGASKDSRYVWEGTLGDMQQDETAFTIHLGDGVHAPDLTSYAYFLRQLEVLDKPLLMVPGESETSGSGAGLYADIFGEPYYSFVAGNACFIVLDDSGGEGIGGEQEAWLRGELEKGQAYQVRLVFLHYPLFEPQGSPAGSALSDPQEARRLQDLFDSYGVTMVFASHARGFYEGAWGNTRYVVTGGAGAPIDEQGGAHAYYNYVKVSLYQDKVEYEVVETPGPPSPWMDRWGYAFSLHSYGFFAVWFWWDLLLLAAAVLVVSVLVLCIRRSRRPRGGAPRGEVPEADSAGNNGKITGA